MRIALLIDSLIAAGAQRQMIILANELSRRGHVVALFVYHDNMQLVGDVDTDHIQVVKVLKTRKFDVGFLRRLKNAFDQFEPDAIVSFLTGPNMWARLCGPMTTAKSIITSERNTNIIQSKLKIAIERLLSRQSTAIFVNTSIARMQLVQSANIPAAKISVIPNGVDTNRFSRNSHNDRVVFRRQFGLSDDDFVIVLPGRVEQQKNHICLIDAVGRMSTSGHRLCVLFFGNENDRELKSQLLRRISQLGLDENFRFCGPATDMVSVYCGVDVVVLPSRWEGLPNVVLEAMACETPVVVSDIADNRRLVEHGVSGYLFDENEPSQLAMHLTSLVDSAKESRQLMGASARKRIQTHYSIKAYVDSFEDLLRRSIR